MSSSPFSWVILTVWRGTKVDDGTIMTCGMTGWRGVSVCFSNLCFFFLPFFLYLSTLHCVLFMHACIVIAIAITIIIIIIIFPSSGRAEL